MINAKIEFLKPKKEDFSLEFDSKIRYMNGAGIYIFYSPSTNSVYIGQSKNIYKRLTEHVRCTFLDYVPNSSKSYNVLMRDDVEMYCCFTEDVYDYSKVKDISRELCILEYYVIKSFISLGDVRVVNKYIIDYDIEDLKSDSFDKKGKVIELKYDFFRFGLRDRLIERFCYTDLSTKKSPRNEVKDLQLKINDLEHQLKNFSLFSSLSLGSLDSAYKKRFEEVEENNLEVRKALINSIHRITVVKRYNDTRDFFKLVKDIDGYEEFKIGLFSICDYIEHVDILDSNIVYNVVTYARGLSEHIMAYFFEYKVTIGEKNEKSVSERLLQSLIFLNKSTLKKLKIKYNLEIMKNNMDLKLKEEG